MKPLCMSTSLWMPFQAGWFQILVWGPYVLLRIGSWGIFYHNYNKEPPKWYRHLIWGLGFRVLGVGLMSNLQVWVRFRVCAELLYVSG